MKKVLINCTNLHGGGGVAVASSFIYQICNGELKHDLKISVFASSKVSENLSALAATTEVLSEYQVIDNYGLKSLFSEINKRFDEYDLVFTVFGPAYFLQKKTIHIFGFAQPWIIYPNNPIMHKMPKIKRLKTKLKFWVQENIFSRADVLIVELEHVRDRLHSFKNMRSKPIEVVYSTIDSIYSDQNRWQSLTIMQDDSSAIKLGIIAKNYPHKNLARLPALKYILKEQYALNVEFFVTFSEEEWSLCSDDFKLNVTNVGTLTLAQCPSFYSQMDGVIFPSLLECFSATPFEAMIMEKPLFASNLPFIRDSCKQFANYFNPLDDSDIARVIAEYFYAPNNKFEILLKARNHVINFSSPQRRAQSYLRIIQDHLGL